MKNKYLSLSLILLISSCSAIHLVPSRKMQAIEFTEDKPNEDYKFIYQTTQNSPELNSIKSLYRLDEIAKKGRSEFEQMLALLDWTNSRWEHSGSNQPSKSNALTILSEAETGKKFRCVEYGIVLKSVLASCGFKARTLGLKSRDVEVTRLGAGHVLTEAWSPIYNKWFMLDGQFNIVPTLDGHPLNAVEFQKAIIRKDNFKLIDFDGEVDTKRREKYLKFVKPYLFFFDFKFDQRDVVYDSLLKVNGKAVLMLVPKDASKPKVFQRKYKMNYLEYTNSMKDFYKNPANQVL